MSAATEPQRGAKTVRGPPTPKCRETTHDRWKRITLTGVVCHAFMWLLSPFTSVAECLLHRRVGERLPGISSFVGLGLMWLFGLMAVDSTMMHLLMFVTVVRIAAVVILSVRARRRGDGWSTRSIGTPWLSTFFPGLPLSAARWAEPFAFLAVAMVAKVINTAAGDYLELSALALLATTFLRHVVTYHHYLDVVDEQLALLPAPASDGQSDHGQLDLPWAKGFPIEMAPVGAPTAEPLAVAIDGE